MKKIKRLFMEWFCNQTLHKINEGGFDIKITKMYLRIRSKTRSFDLKLDNSTYTWGYLASASKQGEISNIMGFAHLVYNTSVITCTDQGLVDDIRKAFVKYAKRMQKLAETQAKNTTDNENDIDLGVVRVNHEYQNMTKKERKSYKKVMRDELNKKE